MSKDGTRMAQCARCHHVKLHHARGCCKCCYNKIMAKGQSALYPTGSGVLFASGSSDADEFRVRFGPSMGRPGLHARRIGGLSQ